MAAGDLATSCGPVEIVRRLRDDNVDAVFLTPV